VNAPPMKPRTWRTITIEYTCLFGVGLFGIAMILWLAT
jgi:hypothetical protein